MRYKVVQGSPLLTKFAMCFLTSAIPITLNCNTIQDSKNDDLSSQNKFLD